MTRKNHMIRCPASAAQRRPAWRQISGRLGRAWRWVLQQVPGPCALCGQRCAGGLLCPGCWLQARAGLSGPRCSRCAEPMPAAMSLLALPRVCQGCLAHPPPFVATVVGMLYVPPVNTLILQVKQARRYGGTGVLASLLLAALQEADLTAFQTAWVVPIPSSPQALRRRGFNPAGEVAAALARDGGWPLQRRLLVWRPAEDHQSLRGKGRRERLRQRDQSFQVLAPVGGLQGQAVILVDDVMTTGATLRAAAAALRAAGAGPVLACAVARTPAPRPR